MPQDGRSEAGAGIDTPRPERPTWTHGQAWTGVPLGSPWNPLACPRTGDPTTGAVRQGATATRV
jgi:hypothetical protein